MINVQNTKITHSAQYQENKQPKKKKKWVKELNRHFPKEDIHVATKDMKRCSQH